MALHVRVGLDDEEDPAALRVRRRHADRDGAPRDAQLHAQPASPSGTAPPTATPDSDALNSPISASTASSIAQCDGANPPQGAHGGWNRDSGGKTRPRRAAASGEAAHSVSVSPFERDEAEPPAPLCRPHSDRRSGARWRCVLFDDMTRVLREQ